MPQTQFKGYELQTTGSNAGTWGTVLNNSVIDLVDTNMGGLFTKALTGDYTLSASEARNVMLRFTGSISTPITVTSSTQGFYMIENLCSDLGGSIVLTNGNGVFSSVLPWGCRCIAFADTANGVRLFGSAFLTNPTEIPTGTRMLFTTTAVPTGWTLITSTDNVGLQITSGTGAATGGSVPYFTLFNRTATDGYALTLNDIPSHGHIINSIGSSGTGGGASGTAHWSHRTAVDGAATGTTDNNVGSNATHAHPLDMRVLTVTTIIGARAA